MASIFKPRGGRRGAGAIPFYLMASSLSSLVHLNPHHFPYPNPNSNPNPRFTKSVRFSIKAERNSLPPPSTDKKSLAVATGEIFLGLASLLIRTRGKDSEVLVEGKGKGEAIAKVVEDPVDEDVVWEQREKDVEAEKERKQVTSPGFSFSAAGLLFPYHLGVAQFLIEKGYIKVIDFVCLQF